MSRLLLAAALASILSACTGDNPEIIGVRSEGETCQQVSDCEAGLDCIDGVCRELEPRFTGPQRGDPCSGDGACEPELVCGRQGVCTTTRGAALDQPCGLTVECEEPLVCNGKTGVCAPDDDGLGTLDLGETCAQLDDCRRPYVCNLQEQCDRVPLYAGPDCSRSDNEVGAFRPYFEVPEGVPPDGHEFYRLPFPSDIRFASGALSLAGHSSPNQALGAGVPETTIAALEEDAAGFAVNQPVFFRFSNEIDPDSLCAAESPTCPDPTVYLVELAGNRRVNLDFATSSTKGQYICQNWLGLIPLPGEPLDHGATYAAVVTTGVRDIHGAAAVRDSDFSEILAGSMHVPAMQPLLDWIAAYGVDATTLAGATVFTTGDPDAIAPALRAAVHAATAPTFDANAVVCDGSGNEVVPSACAPGEADRGCLRGYTEFEVRQGTYQAHAFQSGTRPFLSDGGAFVLDAGGRPIPQATETMCYALATPTGAGPHPVVIFAHGTGGNYRGFLDQTLADGTTLAAALTHVGFAVISFDNVMHGPRQQDPGATPAPALWQDPGRLFFNLANPRAARDNVLQGAADLFSLARLIATGVGPDDVTFDSTNIYFLGHSQGTVIASAFLASEPDLQAAVLSGAGAELGLTILNKKRPLDLSLVAAAFFGDQDLRRIHPMMGLVAMMFASADSVSYAPTWVVDPVLDPLPLLQLTGLGDTYTPDVTQQAQIRAAGLPLVGPVTVSFGVPEQASPQSNNLHGVTAGATQFPTDGIYDGHFVMFNNPEAQTTLTQFFATALAGSPEVQR